MGILKILSKLEFFKRRKRNEAEQAVEHFKRLQYYEGGFFCMYVNNAGMKFAYNRITDDSLKLLLKQVLADLAKKKINVK